MKFGTLNETQIKDAAGGRLDKLFEIWHRDLNALHGQDVEIVLGNRRDSGSPMRGGVLTDAAIEIKDGRTRLMIWYDPLELFYDARIAEIGYSSRVIEEITEMLREDRDPGPEYDPVGNPGKLDFGNVAVQIGRWLMKFRGYKRLRNEERNLFELESFLNLECGIPALYSILEEAGFDRSNYEQKRLAEVYEGLRNMEEPSKRVDRALNALRISNILEFSPDSEIKTGLSELVEMGFTRISSVIGELGVLREQNSLSEADGLNGFMREFVLKYRLPGSWISVDETTGIF